MPLGGRALTRAFGAFYTAVAGTAAVGQVSAAVHWLEWPLPAVVPVVLVVEAGGVVMAARADERRRRGETAYAALAMSAGIAAGGTALNYIGHLAAGQVIAAYVFGGLTACGYLIWLIDAGYRRRDALRAAGVMPPPRPSYGLRRRLLHPRLARLARTLWIRDQDRARRGYIHPSEAMTVEESWQLAELAAVVRREIRRGAGRGGYADVALSLYDAGTVAEATRRMVDHDRLAQQIAARLTPERVAGAIARPGADRALDNEPRTPRSTARRSHARPGAQGSNQAPAQAPAQGEGEVHDVTATPPAPTGRTGGRLGPRKTNRPTAGPDTKPSVEQLAAVLAQHHPGQIVGKGTAAKTLRAVFGSCSDERAAAARNLHNERVTTQGGGDR